MQTSASLKLYSVFEGCLFGKLDYERPSASKKPKKAIETFVILDVSGSMGNNVQRLVERVIPQALLKAGYSNEDPLTLITFTDGSKVFKTTVSEVAKLGLTSLNDTHMHGAVADLGNAVKQLDLATPIRILTLSDGELHDQAETISVASDLAPIFAERAVNSQAVRYFTSNCDPDTRGLASVLQFSTVDVKDATKSGLVDVNSSDPSITDEGVAQLIADLFRNDGVDCDAILQSADDANIYLVPWSPIGFQRVRLAFGENIFWFKTPPTGGLKVNDQDVQIEQCSQLTYENFKMLDAKLQALAFKVKSLQVVNSSAAEEEVKLAKAFFQKFFAAIEETLPAASQYGQTDADYRRRLGLFKDKVRRHLKGQSIQFRDMFNVRTRGVHQLDFAQQAIYMQNSSPLKQAKVSRSRNTASSNSRMNNSSYQMQTQIPFQQNAQPQIQQALMVQSQMLQQPQLQQQLPPQRSAFSSLLHNLNPFHRRHAVQPQPPQLQYEQPEEQEEPQPEQEPKPEEWAEYDITLALHDEVKAMREHLSELDGVDDSNHMPSFFSYATTLAGIKAVCELNADEELFETLDAMEIIELINIVGIACNGPIGEFKDPSQWLVEKIFPGCYMSVSDLLVAAKQSGDKAYLTVPQTDDKITSVIPYFEDERIQVFFQKYAPKLLDYSCSIGMRNKIVDVPQTYWQTMSSGIWKLAQEINTSKLEVSMNSFCRLVKSYRLAMGDESFRDLRALMECDNPVSENGHVMSMNLGYQRLLRLIGPMIQMAATGSLKSCKTLPRILRALYAHESYFAVKLGREVKGLKLTGKNDEAAFDEISTFISHFDCIALLPDLLELAFHDDALVKMKALSQLNEASIKATFGITYSLKDFKRYNIVQAFAFDEKAKRRNALTHRMTIVDLADQNAAEKTVEDFFATLI